ncbi:MAG: rod shape-determining protein RodA [Coriobacteriia bacterium]|nr:rod shape-determining protein RodA [Coriobacteriia bacterium]
MAITPKLQQHDSVSRDLKHIPLHTRVLAVINIPLLAVTALLACYGLLIVSSAIIGHSDYTLSRQLTGILIGLMAFAVLWWFDYRRFARFALPLLIIPVILVLLPLVPGIGVEVNGAYNWVNIFGLQFQPAELAKPLLILAAAALVSQYRGKLNSGKDYLKVLGMLLIPVVCIMAQPDLGTGLVFFVIAVVALFTGGANRKWLIITAIVIIAALVLLIVVDGYLDSYFERDVLIKDYQKNRILVFLDNDIDPTGVSYHLTQAKIAIGSGGLLGKGYGNAMQSGLGFLPETPTDFIFCVLAEEFGFVGSMALIALFILQFFIILRIAFTAKNTFGSIIAASILGMWFFHVLENIGMTCGLMPITGIPLPFVSYGSSFMVTNFIVLGLLCSIWTRRNAGDRFGHIGTRMTE